MGSNPTLSASTLEVQETPVAEGLLEDGKKQNHTRQTDGKRQLAALATLLGLMQTASKLSSELDALASEVGGSLEQIAETAGVPFFDVHNAYRKKIARPKGKKARKRRSAAA